MEVIYYRRFVCFSVCVTSSQRPYHSIITFLLVPMPFETASSCDAVTNRSYTILLKMYDVCSAILDNMATFITH